MDLIISVSQFAPKFENLDYNLDYMSSILKETDSQIMVFPELATSGYYYTDKNNLLNQAINFDSQFISDFQSFATKLNTIIIFGFPEKYKGRVYNSTAILLPNGKLSRVYRKTHLFYKERLVFDEGNTGFFNIYFKEFDLNLGNMICYDWRFPEAARTLALLNSDLIVCPSNLVTGIWDNVMSTRALENKVYLAVANRHGTETAGDDKLTFNGNSAIYSFNGKKIASASSDKDEVISATINPAKTRDKSFNDYNNIFLDRREEYYL